MCLQPRAEVLESRALLSAGHAVHARAIPASAGGRLAHHDFANGLLTFQIQTAPAPKNLAKGP
jgi:hypothetical protein